MRNKVKLFTKRPSKYSTHSEREETIEEIIAECIDAYIDESVEHFFKTRSRERTDDGRYFYSDSELELFKTRYLNAGGSFDRLHIGMVIGDDGKFLCYEVCRKLYYDTFGNQEKGGIFYS